MRVRTWLKDSLGNKTRIGDFVSLADADAAAKSALVPYPAGVYVVELEYHVRVIHGTAADPLIQRRIEEMELPAII